MERSNVSQLKPTPEPSNAKTIEKRIEERIAEVPEKVGFNLDIDGGLIPKMPLQNRLKDLKHD